MHFMAMKKSENTLGLSFILVLKTVHFYRQCIFCSAVLSIISILYPFSFVIPLSQT